MSAVGAQSTSPSAVLLRAERVSKSYRRGAETVAALLDVSLELRAGELTVIAGPSGSGKSTLLNVLCGWEQPDGGSVWRQHAAGLTWRSLGVVPQRLGLLEELTIRENVRLPLDLQRTAGAAARRSRVDELLEHLGLGALAERLPSEVSLGEQQRAAVARALVLEPALVVLDEPTGHQDEDSAEQVASALRTARARGTAGLIATHDPRLQDHVDRVLRIADGRLSPVPVVPG